MYSFTGSNVVRGLSRIEQERRRKVYGLNVIDIPHRSICHFLNEELVNPIFLFEALSCVVWFLLKYYIYLGLILFLTLFDIVSSIRQRGQNQKNLEKQIRKAEQVQVVREDGRVEEIHPEELVPDDIIVIPVGKSSVECDALLLEGTCIVNQCSLTGKTQLVNKTSIAHQPDCVDDEHILYYGTRIVQARRPLEKENKEESLITARVIATGNRTAKGKMINALLHPPLVNSKFEQHAIRLIYFLAALATGGFIYKLTTTLIQPHWVLVDIINCFDLYTICVPSSLALVLSSNIQQTRNRLKEEQIICNSPSSVTLAGSLNVICFDKTGTLTEEDLYVSQVVPCVDGCWIPPIELDQKSGKLSWKKLVSDQSTPPILLAALATCHSLTSFQGQLIGDRLEQKMFEATGCYLGRLPIDYRNFQEYLPIVTWWTGARSCHQVQVLRRFPFRPNLERMGVLCRWMDVYHDPGGIDYFCKGSPAKIMEFCKAQSLPPGWFEMCNRYATQGYRVLAIAHHRFRLSLEEFASFQNGLLQLKRQDLERPSTMDFLGFIVFDNRLQDDTFQVINQLAEASIRTIMMTGDSLETSLNDARECGMIGQNDIVQEIRMVDYQRITTLLTQQSFLKEPRRHYVITGPAWQIVRQYYPELLEECLATGTIFARMSPSQKEELIKELKKVGYTVGVCNNGTSGGLFKAGDVSISLDVLETSTWSTFTWKRTSISCIPELIRQGRWAISTSICEAKFMVVSSLTQFLAILILYSLDGQLELSDGQFFMTDLTIIVLGWLTSLSRPASGRLSGRNPPDSILSPVVVTSFILQILAVLTFLLLSLHLLHYQDWYQVYQPYQDSMLKTGTQYFTDGKDPNLICLHVPVNYTNSDWYRNLWIKKNLSGYTFENYAIFFMSLFQCITLAVMSSTDRLFNYQNIRMKNWPLIGAVLVFIILSLYILLDPPCFVIRLLELQLPLGWSFRYIMIGLIIGHMLTAVFIKELIVNIGIERLIRSDWWLARFHA